MVGATRNQAVHKPEWIALPAAWQPADLNSTEANRANWAALHAPAFPRPNPTAYNES